MTLGAIFRLAVAVLREPSLVPVAVRQLSTLAPSGWWRASPRLPVPSAEWVTFRQVTATGDGSGEVDPEDLILWLRWCRSMQELQRV